MRNPISLKEGCYLDDSGRDRCQASHKIAYDSEREAMQAANARRFFIKRDLSAYQDKSCGHWHLTSQEW